MPNDRINRVFLSYASEDLETVRNVYDGLIKRSLHVWFDKENLGPGKWKKQIRKAIARSRFFIICISKAALKKTGDDTPGFQDEELDYAYSIADDQPETEFTILPVRLEDCSRGDFRLSAWQQYDLFGDMEKGLDKLAVDLGGISLSDVTAKDERTEDEKLIDGLFAKAVAEYHAGNFTKSIGLYESILAVSPEYAVAEALTNKGSTLIELDKLHEALDSYDKALKFKPYFPEAWYGRGWILAELKEFNKAIESYDKALKYKPDFAEAWFNKGIAFKLCGRKKEALFAFNETLKLNPDITEAITKKEELI